MLWWKCFWLRVRSPFLIQPPIFQFNEEPVLGFRTFFINCFILPLCFIIFLNLTESAFFWFMIYGNCGNLFFFDFFFLTPCSENEIYNMSHDKWYFPPRNVYFLEIIPQKSNYAKHIENFRKYGILNITLPPFSYFGCVMNKKREEEGGRRAKEGRAWRGKRQSLHQRKMYFPWEKDTNLLKTILPACSCSK